MKFFEGLIYFIAMFMPFLTLGYIGLFNTDQWWGTPVVVLGLAYYFSAFHVFSKERKPQ